MHAALATSRSLRGALARVELAASQLGRDAATPHARALVRSISLAVAELDRGLAALTAALVRDALPRRADAAPVSPVLAEVVARLAPALAARGLRLDAAFGRDDAVLAGDPHVVRRTALLLLRCAADGLGAGGRLVLSAARASEDGALVIEVEGEGPARQDGGDAPARAALRALAAAERASLEQEARREGALRRERLALRLAGEAACSAS